MHAFDRRTDRQTEFSSLDRVCITCSAAKTTVYSHLVRVSGVLADHIEFNAQVSAASALGQKVVIGASSADHGPRHRATQDVRFSRNSLHRRHCVPEPAGKRI